MKPEVSFTPHEARPGAPDGHTAVVIDVQRATSTNIAALANGARAVHPTGTTAAARRATTASRKLEEVGHGDDVAVCAAVDRYDVVPELRDRQLVLPQPIDPACSR